MGLADATFVPSPHHAAGCSIGRLWDRLDADDRDALVDVLFGTDGTDPDKATFVTECTGETVKDHTVGTHRRGQCGCSGLGWAQPDG